MRKTVFGLIIVALFVVALVQVPASCSANVTKEETARAFLENVVELDVAKYEFHLKSQKESVDEQGITEIILLYELNSEESKIDCTFIFKNDAMIWCNITPIDGLPVLTRPNTDTLDLAKRFMDRYQSESKAGYLQPLLNMLNNITEIKPLTITSNDVRLTIVRDASERFEWMDAPNGIHNTYNQITLVFRNGTLKLFSDNWRQYPIGSVDMFVSEEQAVNLAKESAKNYSYAIGGSIVNNLTVDETTRWRYAELTMQPKDNALYPQWEVVLPLDTVYPGMVTGIRVRLWADTGEINYLHETTIAGALQNESIGSNNTQTATPLPPETPSDSQPPIETYPDNNHLFIEIIAGVAIASMLLAVFAVALKKKNNASNALG
ncbi:MAG: hypothetical protein NWE92_09020 [Candidatus Bathyarchaeota archaeon]|nr:hypothetical protein [Candidatus Bathyarchaeota archaeon]